MPRPAPPTLSAPRERNLDSPSSTELRRRTRAGEVTASSVAQRQEIDDAPKVQLSSAPSREELEARTADDLREFAAEREIEGRSSMNKGELVDALAA